jgi:replicative DNA helicase
MNQKPKKLPEYTEKGLARRTLEKLPPYNIEAEQAVLGAIFLENPAAYKALEIFNAEDFYRKSHQKIFRAMLIMLERGEAIDLLTLREELDRRKELDEIGGPAYLTTLIDQVPTAANIEFHAKIVHEKSIGRQLLNASIEIATRCYDEHESVGDILADAEQKIFSICEDKVKRSFATLSEVVTQGYKDIERLADHQNFMIGVPSGFIELDRITSGAQPSDLIIIAARPSMGKTSLALNMGKHAGKHHCSTAIFSLEMSKEQLGLRLLCSEARVDSQHVRQGIRDDQEWERLVHAVTTLSNLPIFIDDTPAITVLEIKAKTKRLKIEQGLGLVIIDYLQLMQTKTKHENRQQEIAEISRNLKALAKELNVPVIALSQLSRALELRKDKHPQLSDLRESGAIEQDADVVIFIYRPEIYEKDAPPGLVELEVAKQRNGPIGTAMLAFLKEYTTFENLAPQGQTQEATPDDDKPFC